MGNRIYPPLAADHPSVLDATPCWLCKKPFRAGDVTTLVSIRPADDEEARKMIEGRPYTAEAVHVHAHCVGEFEEGP